MFPHPDEVGIVFVAAGPVEAGDAFGGVLGGFDGFGVVPGMALGVGIGEGEGAEFPVEDGEGIDPGVSLHDPGAEVLGAGVGFLNEDGGGGGIIDARDAGEGVLAIANPHTAVHAVGF